MLYNVARAFAKQKMAVREIAGEEVPSFRLCSVILDKATAILLVCELVKIGYPYTFRPLLLLADSTVKWYAS